MGTRHGLIHIRLQCFIFTFILLYLTLLTIHLKAFFWHLAAFVSQTVAQEVEHVVQ